MMDPSITSAVDNQVWMARVANTNSISIFEQSLKDYARNAGLFQAAGLAIPPPPNPPMLKFPIHSVLERLFIEFDQRSKESISSGEPVGEIDLSTGFTYEHYVPAPVAAPATVPQPANPIGVLISVEGDPEAYAPAKGDAYPAGKQWTNKFTGVTYQKWASHGGPMAPKIFVWMPVPE